MRFLNIICALLSLVGIVLTILSGNYIAAVWAFCAFISQVELVGLKDY